MRESRNDEEYKVALDSAVKVARAIVNLDIPLGHKKKFLNYAVWHVTVPKESMKYRTRFVSVAAKAVMEEIEAYSEILKRLRSLARLGNKVDRTDRRKNIAVLAKFGEPFVSLFENPIRLREVINEKIEEIKNLRKCLQHDHVDEKSDLITEMLKPDANVETVLTKARSCTVTRDEHKTLGDKTLGKMNGQSGEDRYRSIRVLDTFTGEYVTWATGVK